MSNKTFKLSPQEVLEALGFYLIEEGLVEEEDIDNVTLVIEEDKEGNTIITLLKEYS